MKVGRKIKKVRAKDLEQTLNKYCRREITQYEAGKELGVSTPTFMNWANAVYNNGWVINSNLKFVYFD